MRVRRSFALCITAALFSVGCEVHERDRNGGSVQAEVAVGAPQGAVIEGPGVVAVDVEPDPAQRVYVYDEGYPPGAYIYNDYYYYGGYRYPRDVFVNQYVQENIRQHRYANADDNRRQGQPIEQRQRADFAKNHGARQNPAAQPVQTPREAASVQQPNVERPENKTAPKEDNRPANQQPEVRTPANGEHPANVARPENKTPANADRPEKKATPAKEEHKPNAEEPKREEQK